MLNHLKCSDHAIYVMNLCIWKDIKYLYLEFFGKCILLASYLFVIPWYNEDMERSPSS